MFDVIEPEQQAGNKQFVTAGAREIPCVGADETNTLPANPE